MNNVCIANFLFILRKSVIPRMSYSSKSIIDSKYKCHRFEGKVAIVTASTQGIGLAIAERLAHEGAKVMVSSRKESQVNMAVETLRSQGLKVSGVVCHVANEKDRENLFKKTEEIYGGLDVLVSNAAVNPSYGGLFETNEESWDKIFDVNVKSTFQLCKEALPYFEKRGSGSIVIVSSIGGYQPVEGVAAYCISKTALLGMVKAMTLECSRRNIRVNGIAPGIIKTKFSQALWQEEETEDYILSTIPLRRLGKSEECAGAVSFLASEDASYMTGETIIVSGGVPSRL